jgi:hypothetical protein
MRYLPRLEPAARGSNKCKAKAAPEAESIPKKSRGTKKCRRVSSRAGDRTSERERLLEKLLKLTRKLTATGAEAHSSGLSTRERAFVIYI